MSAILTMKPAHPTPCAMAGTSVTSPNYENRRDDSCDSRYGAAHLSKRDKYPGDYGGRGGRYNRGGGYRFY